MIVFIGAITLIMLSALAFSGSQGDIKLINSSSQDNIKPANNDMPLNQNKLLNSIKELNQLAYSAFPQNNVG